MSREVEVKNIQMTATVPEDIQLSLGHLYNINNKTADVNSSTVNGHTGLAGNEGLLAPKSVGSTADDGEVKPPNEGMDDVSMLDWASSADISAYYQLGKIIPASSTDGKCILFTPDADGVGKSLKAGAKYYYAVGSDAATPDILTPIEDKTTANETKGIAKNYRTKLHANTEADDAWDNYTPGSAYDVTNHDGYYVDIPVWLRTSSTDGANLAVDAYVTTNAAKDEDDLYLAARAVVLYDSAAKIGNGAEGDAETAVAGATPNASSGLIEIKQDKWSSFKSIVDFMTSTNSTGEAVASANATTHIGTYANGTHYTGTQIVKLPKSNGTGAYGTASKVIIRVWLEGEDPNCWNQNAGQDFNICLKFTKDALVQATAADGSTPDGANYAMANSFTADATGVGTLNVGDTITVSVPVTDAANAPYALVYRVIAVDGSNNPTWELYDGSYHVASAGKKHQITLTGGDGTDVVANSDQIADWLNNHVKTKANAKIGVTVSEVSTS
jgi:hypothetical protein